MAIANYAKFGHGSLISFDATIGMPFFYCMKCHKINMFHNIVINVQGLGLVPCFL
jgi:hypothetical protein